MWIKKSRVFFTKVFILPRDAVTMASRLVHLL
jgi:hypothetical protein